MRTVMIGTPADNAKLSVYYCDSLINTLRQCPTDMQIIPVWIADDALVCKARNDLFHIAYENKVDDLVFIDSDESWNPENFFKLLNHSVDYVGGTARKKTEEIQFVAKAKEIPMIIEDNNLIEVNGLGNGFTRFSQRAITLLYEASEEYTDDQNNKKRLVFNTGIKYGKFVSEDIFTSNKWLELEESLWLDPSITCNHYGEKEYSGNFMQWAFSNKLLKFKDRG